MVLSRVSAEPNTCIFLSTGILDMVMQWIQYIYIYKKEKKTKKKTPNITYGFSQEITAQGEDDEL